MITLKEINPKGFETTPGIDINLLELHRRINIVRQLWGKPMIVTSGFRSLVDHKRIYMEKARKAGIQNPRIPMGSLHLSGEAVDIRDDGSLYDWLKQSEQVLIDAGLWCEEGTKGWVHFQTRPPRSGKRWFLP